jgi:hypothetical protein
LAEHGGRAIGRDSSQGPGWWLASDGKWYPPELSPENRAKKKRKKKAPEQQAPTQKAAGAPAPSEAGADDDRPVEAPLPASGDPAVGKTRPSSTHRGGQVVAAKQAARDEAGVGSPSAEAPVLEFDDDAPPTDQIVARRIQAREQHLLLSGARQQAALRALSSLGVEPETELVGVGGRSFDAAAARAADLAPLDAPPEAEALEPSNGAPPESSAPVATSAALDAPPVGDLDRPTADDTGEAGPVADEPPTPEGLEPIPAPHQPTKRPEPASIPMGTEAPFMEVRGSALGTDIERIGEKILIFADRVELRDRGNTVRQTIAYTELAGVVIQKKIMGPTLVIESTGGETMTAKALRPELATGAKAMIEKHARRRRGGPSEPVGEPALAMADTAPSAGSGTLAAAPVEAPAPAPTPAVVELREPPPTRMPHKHVLAAMIDELHAAGILDAEEHAQKLALLEAIAPN